MEIRPAHINQVVSGAGRMVEVSSDVGMVADDLKRIDPSLRVRFAIEAAEPFFAVYCQPDERTTYLVLTVKAHQNRFGVWEGLDSRVVRRIERIGSDSYDYAAEVDKRNQAADRAKEDRRRRVLEQANDEGYAHLRKLVGRNCARITVPRDL